MSVYRHQTKIGIGDVERDAYVDYGYIPYEAPSRFSPGQAEEIEIIDILYTDENECMYRMEDDFFINVFEKPLIQEIKEAGRHDHELCPQCYSPLPCQHSRMEAT